MKLQNIAFKLHLTITMVFSVITIPVTLTIIAANYHANQRLISSYSDKFIERTVQENIQNVTGLLNPMVGHLSTFMTLMENRADYFRDDASADYLYRIVASNEAVYAAYAGFEDGGFRQVWRAIQGRKVFGQDIPPETRFVSRSITAHDGSRTDSYALYGSWRETVGGFSGPAVYDARTRDYYKSAMRQPGIQISDPYLFASSQVRGITLSARIADPADGHPIGVAAIDLTLDTLTRFLDQHRVTEHSITLIADSSGALVAGAEDAHGEGRAAEKGDRSQLAKLGDMRITTAVLERELAHGDRVVFRLGPDRTEYIAVFSPFPKDFNKPWELITITPTDDFVGSINRTNRNLLLFGLGIFIIQILIIHTLARSISKPLENLAGSVTGIRNFQFRGDVHTRSRVREVRFLYEAVALLENTISSFTSYVPRGLVQELLSSGIGAQLGVESRYLTIMFTDLAGFSTLSESEPSQLLLRRVSDYFSVLTRAIEQNHGTVDKFIGDAVMAFWGAPRPHSHHAYDACVAAVRSQRRMVTLNRQWAAEGLPPLTVRIGIHCDSVLVGNIGSDNRLSYSVMGDGVNIAARLEGMNKEWGTRSCVSHSVFREAGERLWLRPIDTVTVKGRKGELLIYELLAVRDGDDEVLATPEEMELCRLTTTAYGLYAAENYAEATEAYQAILERFPGDHVAVKMLNQARMQAVGLALSSA